MASEPNTSRVFARGVLVSLVAVVVIGVINWLTRRLLANGLDREAYGFFYSAFALASLLVALVSGGLDHAALDVGRPRTAMQRPREPQRQDGVLEAHELDDPSVVLEEGVEVVVDHRVDALAPRHGATS